jgi:hypothetical protein
LIRASHSSSSAGGRAFSAGNDPDHAGLALRDHEIGHGDDEQRRTDHG